MLVEVSDTQIPDSRRTGLNFANRLILTAIERTPAKRPLMETAAAELHSLRRLMLDAGFLASRVQVDVAEEFGKRARE
jgi:hypothetical protein